MKKSTPKATSSRQELLDKKLSPFGYDSRSMMNDRDFEETYNNFDGPPGRQHLMHPIGLELPPGSVPPDSQEFPFMVHAQRHSYAANYRDNRLPSTYRQTLREPYSAAGPPSRSSSPSYKILCITNINSKIDDLSVKNALMSDFGRFGDISVSICHDSGERLAYIYFRSYEDAREARVSKTRTLFFDRPIEIEPIYDPRSSPVDGPSPPPPPPPSYSQILLAQQPSVYSQRGRRSITPPEYQYDMNGPAPNHRRQAMPPHMQHPHAPTPPIPIDHRPLSPSEYPAHHTSVYGSHGTNSPPIETGLIPGYDRRESYGNHYPQPGHMSPYSSPSHDLYRSPHPTGPQYSPSAYMGAGPQHLPQPPMSRLDRERLYTESRYSRSPLANDAYYPPDRGGPPPASLLHPYHASARSSAHHRASPPNHPSSRAGLYHASAPASYRHRPPPPPSPPHHSYNRPDPPMRYLSREYRRERLGIGDPHGEHEDGRPSRVLLVNNIDSTKSEADLREIFEPLGIIEEIEVKKVNSEISSALIRFSSMDGAYKAKTANHGRYIGSTKCSIVYGKVSASRRLWIGGLSASTTVRSLEDECSKYGDLVNMEYTSGRPYSYVEFETPNQAQFAAYHLKFTLVPAPDRKVRIEFVDPERSEKMSRHEANSHTSETKSRATNESSWASNERETTPTSLIGRKRSASPAEPTSKRICPINDIPPGANTFKHERLAAAAAAKARSSATTSPIVEKPSEPPMVNQVEFNNNRNDQLGNGQLTTNTSQASSDPISDTELQPEIPSLEMLVQCANIRELVSLCPTFWQSQIALRNFIFPSKIHLCSGRKQIIDKYLSRSTAGNSEQAVQSLLRITQRWRLHPQPKLEEVKKRMLSSNLAMLIITSCRELSGTDGRAAISKNDLTSKGKQKMLQNGEENSVAKKEVTSAIDTPTSVLLDGTNSIAADCGAGLNDSKTADNVSACSNSAEPSNSTATPTRTTNATSSQSNQTTSTANNQSRPLRNLISYLEQKDAAGVISLNALDSSTAAGELANNASGTGLDGSSKLLYAFPPGDFALSLIKHMASNLSTEIFREEFLLGVIVGGNVEGARM